MTFILSIETPEGAFQHPFHMGTDEAVAKQMAEETFHARNRLAAKVERDSGGKLLRTVTVALTKKNYFNCYDGEDWSMDR